MKLSNLTIWGISLFAVIGCSAGSNPTNGSDPTNGNTETATDVGTPVPASASPVERRKPDSLRFVLQDAKTQIPAVTFMVPSKWYAGGRTNWTNDETPWHYYVWTASPDKNYMYMVASGLQTADNGTTIQTSKFLNNTGVWDQISRDNMAKQTGATGLTLVDARFTDGTAFFGTFMQQARQNAGLQGPMAAKFCELQWKGTRYGKPCTVSLRLGLVGWSMQMGSFTSVTIIQVLTNYGYCCPVGQEAEALAGVERFFVSQRHNPKFQNLVADISRRNTKEIIEMQDYIHEIVTGVNRSADATQERIRYGFHEYMTDTYTATDPITGNTLILDNNYDHARKGSDGSVMYYNGGENFDPNSDPAFNSVNWSNPIR